MWMAAVRIFRWYFDNRSPTWSLLLNRSIGGIIPKHVGDQGPGYYVLCTGVTSWDIFHHLDLIYSSVSKIIATLTRCPWDLCKTFTFKNSTWLCLKIRYLMVPHPLVHQHVPSSNGYFKDMVSPDTASVEALRQCQVLLGFGWAGAKHQEPLTAGNDGFGCERTWDFTETGGFHLIQLIYTYLRRKHGDMESPWG